MGVLSANHGRPPTIVQGRPCCVRLVKTPNDTVVDASTYEKTLRDISLAGYSVIRIYEVWCDPLLLVAALLDGRFEHSA